MTVEELLDKLENDRVEAERVWKECHERTRERHMEIKEAFDFALDADEFYKHLDDLTSRFRDAEYAEHMACCKINRITTAINELKERIGQA